MSYVRALQGTLSLRGQKDAAGFIDSFTGSHHFVMDYLLEEVLDQQPESVQAFLLRTRRGFRTGKLATRGIWVVNGQSGLGA